MKKILFYTIVICFISCSNYDPVTPYSYNNHPNFTKGETNFFGAYYTGISSNVLSLNLYSDSIEIDEKGNIGGTGQILRIIDIFIPTQDSALVEGTYKAEVNGNAFTFYAKEDKDENTLKNSTSYPFATIQYFEEDASKSTKKMIIGGSFTVTYSSNNCRIDFNLTTDDKQNLKGSFNGSLAKK